MPIPSSALLAIQQRLARNSNPKQAQQQDAAKAEKWAKGEERDLQDKIQQDAERRGLFVLRSRMDKKTVFVKGFPDLAIFGPQGRCLLLEAKTEANTLSGDQRACHEALLAAGAVVLTVWNLVEAIAAIRNFFGPET